MHWVLSVEAERWCGESEWRCRECGMGCGGVVLTCRQVLYALGQASVHDTSARYLHVHTILRSKVL